MTEDEKPCCAGPGISDGQKVKAAGTAGATAGGLGASFAACHSVCQALVAVFAVFGIALFGMPLAFLEPYSIPLLVLAAMSIGFSVWICRKHKMPLGMLMRPLGAGIGVAVVIVLVLFFFGSYSSTGMAYISAGEKTASESSKCDPQPGYTPEEWQEHMSHHPSQYAGCPG